MKKLGMHSLVAIVVLAAVFGFQSIPARTAGIDPDMTRRILAATYQINLYPAGGAYFDQGLASLVLWEGQRLLVTHNHWTVLKELEKVEILSAGNELLLTLDRRSFLRLILHSDPGTMVLVAPAGLEGEPAGLVQAADLKAGDHVLIAQQTAPGSSPAAVAAAEIRSLYSFEKYPAVFLARTDPGETIHGDSGGGIWYDGQLVGNLWAMYYSKKNGPQKLGQITIGAMFPMETLALMSERSASAPNPEQRGREQSP